MKKLVGIFSEPLNLDEKKKENKIDKGMEELVKTANKHGVEVFDTEILKEIDNLSPERKYSPSEIAFLIKTAKKSAEKRLTLL